MTYFANFWFGSDVKALIPENKSIVCKVVRVHIDQDTASLMFVCQAPQYKDQIVIILSEKVHRFEILKMYVDTRCLIFWGEGYDDTALQKLARTRSLTQDLCLLEFGRRK